MALTPTCLAALVLVFGFLAVHPSLTWDSASRLVRIDRTTGRGHTVFRYDLDGRL